MLEYSKLVLEEAKALGVAVIDLETQKAVSYCNNMVMKIPNNCSCNCNPVSILTIHREEMIIRILVNWVPGKWRNWCWQKSKHFIWN